MLQVAFARSFERSLRRLPPPQKVDVQRRVDAFILAMEARRIPTGYGLKKLGRDVWELRTDLAIRVLFAWDKSTVTFLLVGNHNEVQRFLRHYL